MYTEQRKPIVISPQEQQKLLNVVSQSQQAAEVYRSIAIDEKTKAFLWKSGCIALAGLCFVLWLNSARANNRAMRLLDRCTPTIYK